MKRAAKALNLRSHVVGKAGNTVELHSAVDIGPTPPSYPPTHSSPSISPEGHIGLDNRLYLLDLSRSFPPEAPSVTQHLDDLYEDGSIVLVKFLDPLSAQTGSERWVYLNGTVNRAYSHGRYYDILFQDGSIAKNFPVSNIFRKNLSIFWRHLRFLPFRPDPLSLTAPPGQSMSKTVANISFH
jgi:hypothetical protein